MCNSNIEKKYMIEVGTAQGKPMYASLTKEEFKEFLKKGDIDKSKFKVIVKKCNT